MDNLKSEYNILLKAGSPLGYKHSKEAIAKMSAAQQGEKNPMYGRLGKDHPMFGKIRPEGSGRPSNKISVLDLIIK